MTVAGAGRRRRPLGPGGGRGPARRARPRGHGPLGRHAAGAARAAVDVPRAALRPAGLRPLAAGGAARPASTSRSTTWPGCSTGRPAVLAGPQLRRDWCAWRWPSAGPTWCGPSLAYEAPEMWASWWPGSTVRRTEAMALPDPEDAAEWFLRRMIGDDTWERLPPAMRAERRAEGHALLAEMRSVRPPAPAAVHRGRDHGARCVAAFGSETRPHHMRATEELARDARPGRAARSSRVRRHGAHLTPPERAFAEPVVAGRVAPGERGGEREPRRDGVRWRVLCAAWRRRRRRRSRAGGLRPVRRGQPRRPPDRDAAGPDRAGRPARPGAGVLGGGHQRRRAGRGPDDAPASGGWSGCGGSSTARSSCRAACCPGRWRWPAGARRSATTPGCAGRSRSG